MEKQLLKLLLNKEFFNKNKHLLTAELFADELKRLYLLIQDMHEAHAGDFSAQEVKTTYLQRYVLTTAQRRVFASLMADIEEEDAPNESVATEILATALKKETARQIASAAIDIVNTGGGDFTVIEEVLANHAADAGQRVATCDTSLEDILRSGSRDGYFPFMLQPLQERVGGMGRGHLGVLFARPEVGKSSLIAGLCSGYLSLGLNVAYFRNEEPPANILINFVRALLNKTELELYAEAGTTYPVWEDARSRLHMYNADTMSFEECAAIVRATEPDVVVFDQIDKVALEGRFNRTDEKLKELYVCTRRLAATASCLVWNVSQASADGEGKRYLTYDMLDNSKTGKAGEADVIIGVGKNDVLNEDGLRYLTITKNKISGWHGPLTACFDPDRNQWSE